MAKIGLIGTGMISEFHLLGLTETDAEIAAIADLDETRARETTKGHEAEYYSDYRKLLENRDIDSVIIALATLKVAATITGLSTLGRT